MRRRAKWDRLRRRWRHGWRCRLERTVCACPRVELSSCRSPLQTDSGIGRCGRVCGNETVYGYVGRCAAKLNRPRRRKALVADIEPSSFAWTAHMLEMKPSAAANGVACRWETVCVVDAGVCGPHSAVLGDAYREQNRPRRWRAMLRLCHSVAGERASVSPLLIGSTRQRASDLSTEANRN